MTSLYDQANEAGIKGIGLNPKWGNQVPIVDEPAQFTGPPDGAAAGVALEGAARALVQVSLRENARYRSVRLVIGTFSNLSTYSVSIDGTAIAGSVTPADEDELWTELAANIMADAVVGGAAASPKVNAYAIDEAGLDVAESGEPAVGLVITGAPGHWIDYYVDPNIAGGAGTWTVTADPTSCTLQVWGLRGGFEKTTGSGPSDGTDARDADWAAPPSALYTLDRRGFIERFDVAGLSRLYGEVGDIDGHASDGADVAYRDPDLWIAPAIVETS